MVKSRLYRILSRFADVKPGEETIAFLLFSYFFLVIAPHTILKSLRNAAFLEGLGALSLPFAYLLTAIAMGFIVALHSKLQVIVQRKVLLVFTLVFFIFNCLFLWWLFPQGWKWLPLVFWIWANIFSFALSTQFWISVNDVLNPREAKRLIGFFGSGGILGGLVGGSVTGVLVKVGILTPNSLFLVASCLLILGVFVVRKIYEFQKRTQEIRDKEMEVVSKQTEQQTEKVGFKVCMNTVKKNSYLRLLAGVVTLTVVVSTLIDFQFNKVIEDTPSVSGDLTSFFLFFNSGLLILPLLFQLFMTSELIKRFGIRFALLIFPIILLLGSLGIAVFISFYIAIFLKGSDKGLSYSLNQSVRELLYIPVSPELKYKAKIFIDMFLNRFAKGIGAVILLILLQFSIRIPHVSIVSIVSSVLILLWMIVNIRAGKEYVTTVKQRIKQKWDRADRWVAEKVDVDYTKLVFDTLESKNRSSVLYAMHLFDLIKKNKMSPELEKLLSYKSDEMKISTLGALFEEEDTGWAPQIEDSLDDEVLEKEIKEIMSLDVYQEVMKDYVDKKIKDQGDKAETAKMELAKAIGLMEADSPLVEELEELLQDESHEVGKYAMESAAEHKKREYIPAIIEKMKSPVSREDALYALQKYGFKIAGTLSDYLGDPEEDIEMRKGTARLLASIGTQEAADFLILELQEQSENLATEIIDSLDRIRTEKPDVQFREETVKKALIREVRRSCRIIIDINSLQEREKIKTEVKLEEKLDEAKRNIFRLLGLIYPKEDIVKAYQNIRTGTKDSMAYAVELLDNTLHREMKSLILPLVEEHSLEEKARRCRAIHKTFPED